MTDITLITIVALALIITNAWSFMFGTWQERRSWKYLVTEARADEIEWSQEELEVAAEAAYHAWRVDDHDPRWNEGTQIDQAIRHGHWRLVAGAAIEASWEHQGAQAKANIEEHGL